MGKGCKPRIGHSPTVYANNFDDIFRKGEQEQVVEDNQEDIEAIAAKMIDDLTGIAYDTYTKEVGGVAFNGDKLPDWKEFGSDPSKEKQANAWRAAIMKVLEEVSI